MGDRTLREQLVIDEIAGKNAAIHAYDRIIWVVRSGYLSLFFAGWALILKALVEAEQPVNSIQQYIPMMLVMSAGLTIGGLVVDLNYVLRKFRVIAALNRLMELSFLYGNALDSYKIKDNDTVPKDEHNFLATLQVSGDAGVSHFTVPKGRKTAIIASLVVYITPFVCLGIIWNLGSF